MSFYELKIADLYVEKNKPIPLIYKQLKLECGYKPDLIVENKVIVELKSVESLNDVHSAQVLTYLNVSGCKVGLLINLNVLVLKTGLKRWVKNY
jgi:GxxExxY protein